MKLLAFSLRSRRPPRAAPVPGRRLRIMGALVLVFGLGTAGLVYAWETRDATPSMEDLMPGYSQANARQMGLYYGHAGEIMWGWQEDLARPGVQAGIIIAIASLVALGFLRAAWLEAEDARSGDPQRDPH
jgi:hypothetical protein